MPLTLICGPMFAGKTRTLIARVRGAAADGRDAIAAKPHIDTRFGSRELTSHDGAHYPAVVVSSASELRSVAAGVDLVGFDEAQFLSLGLVDVLRELAERTEVVAAGLDLDFRGQPFPATALLAEFSDGIHRLTSTCTRCGGYATMTQRWVDGGPADLADPVIRLGGREVYAPRCPTCFAAERSPLRVD